MSAALAQRSYGQSDIASALGWAVLPIAAAISVGSGVGVGRLRGGLPAVRRWCVVAAALFRAIGTGQLGLPRQRSVVRPQRAGAGGSMLPGCPAVGVGAGLAAIATLACRAVSQLTARFARFDAATA